MALSPDNVFVQLGLSLLLGLIVGLQRQRTESTVAGIRTFALIAVLGTVCAWLASAHGAWILAAGLVALAGQLIVANLVRVKAGDFDPGLTTEIAALLMFGVGACVASGQAAAAVTVGGALAVLLHVKEPMHRFVAAIGKADLAAIMQFVLVTLVILPVLPNRTFGPYDVLNPFKIWLFVVLIVGISLCSYTALKLFGPRAGTWLGGVLGGLVSSTATTVSQARRTKSAPGSEGPAALIVMIASGVVYVRVLFLMALLAPPLFPRMAPPLVIMFLVVATTALAISRQASRPAGALASPKNPAELKSALVFGGLYAVVVFAVTVARAHLGDSGYYAVAVLSGLTDMDAITLSSAQLASSGRLAADMAWRGILVASMANLVFKAGIVGALGTRALFRRIAFMFGLALAVGAAILLLWPGAGSPSP